MQAPISAPAGLNHIPAMTTDAERSCYYRLVREALGPDQESRGAIVELGAWLGASTAYIAAAIRDSGLDAKVHVFDKFQSKPGHARKVQAFYANHKTVGAMPMGPCLEQLRTNLGDLMRHVRAHRGLIEQMEWDGGPIAVLITDAPKRVPQISAVLTTLRSALQPGAVMAWQDFCHFPSYEIAACLYRLRDHLEVVEAVTPGTTLVFRVRSQWTAEEVSLEALALSRWTPDEIAEAWDYWLGGREEWRGPVKASKAALFLCGEAMFLCDTGHPAAAVKALSQVKDDHLGMIEKKWAYLRENRPDFVKRYAPLFEVMAG
jgi:hypothetical protein